MTDYENEVKNTADLSAVTALAHYAENSHQICCTIIKACEWVFFMLPVFLLVMMKLAGTDKVVILLIWIVGMFALAIIIIIVGFFDKRLKTALDSVYGEGSVPLPALIAVEPAELARRVKQTEENAKKMLSKEAGNEKNPEA